MPKPPKKKTDRKDKKETVAHYESILLENIRSDFKMVTEAVDMMREKVEKMEEDFRGEILAAKHELHGEMLVTKQDLRAYMVEMKQDLHQEIVQSKNEVIARIDKIDEKLIHHDKEIHQLKAAVSH